VVSQGALARSYNPGGPERADDALPSEAFGINETKSSSRRTETCNERPAYRTAWSTVRSVAGGPGASTAETIVASMLKAMVRTELNDSA